MVGGAERNWCPPLLLLLAAQALIFHPRGADADILSPLISPLRNASCQLAQCGQGICKPSDDSNRTSLLGLLMPSYTCECDPGWRRLFNNDSFLFLPCVLPNCTMNYGCTPDAPSPPPPPSTNFFNSSIFDPCTFASCGEGACVKTSALTYHCECRPGSSNLLNLTNLPCYRNCVLGADCKNLGIGNSSPQTPSSSSAPTTSGSSPGTAIIGLRINMIKLSTLMMALVVAMA